MFGAVILIDACHRNEQQEGEKPIAAAAVSQPPALAEAPSPPDVSPNLSAAVAVFQNEKLIACVDLDVASDFISRLLSAFQKAPNKNLVDGGVTAQALVDNDVKTSCEGGKSILVEALEKRSKGAALFLLPKGNAEAITSNCKTQFSGRTVDSRCNVTLDLSEVFSHKVDAGSGYASLTIRHYDFAENDGFLRGCLATKGIWWELEKDSAKYSRAHASELLKREMKNWNN